MASPSLQVTALAEAEFGSGSRAGHLLDLAQVGRGYSREIALALLGSGRALAGESWAERCLAMLLLENKLLELGADEFTEFDVILTHLGLKTQREAEAALDARVLGEGYSTRDPRGFAAELLRRMRRLNRVHEPVRHAGCDPVDWRYFLRTARDISKLTLARYTIPFGDVLAEIESRLLITRGIEDPVERIRNSKSRCHGHGQLNAPAYETSILDALCAGNRIYWCSERCGSELNSLVEYPLTSAVLVIKPPGSDYEIEIKRAGVRGLRLLDVISKRNGSDAPASHRLFGGSLGWLAQREAAAAEIFSRIVRIVHDRESPCSRGVLNSCVVTVPTVHGESHILDYLTDEAHFGPDLDETLMCMNSCVESFPSDTGVVRASYEGTDGATLQFIGQARPQQAIIFGSTSFRLDRIAVYLSVDGPEEYFRAGLGRGYNLSDARWLADSVLEEILGEVDIPPDGFENYPQYVSDAFRIPRNRERANKNFLSVAEQIGDCWGTLLAVRGFSDGESFVLRNVGLKSLWRGGEWHIRIIFMDHDDLTVAGSRYQYLWPWREVGGMERDQVHILGGPMGDIALPGELGVLQKIYRVNPEVGEEGLRVLKAAIVDAYDKTQIDLAHNPELRGLFYPRFLDGYRDFDELVPEVLRTDPQSEAWKPGVQSKLQAKGYDNELVDEYVKTFARFRDFFEQMSFLYSR
jgi:hypothetical protein